MDRSAREAWKVGRGESRDVADRAVDHIACGAPVFGNVLHDLADQRPRLVAAAIDHDHVTGPDQFQRPVDRKIVAGPCAHGEGCAHQLAAAMERPQTDGARQAGKVVADHRGRRAPERLDQLRCGLRHARHGRGDAHKDGFSLAAAACPAHRSGFAAT